MPFKTLAQKREDASVEDKMGGRKKAMGGGMMMKRNVAMKKGGKIPPQLKKIHYG
jgi:hypothetical protein